MDVERVENEHEAELVASIARDTGTVFQASETRVHHAGDGYKVQLPDADDGGFREGDSATCSPGSGILVISPFEQDREDGARLPADVVSIRRSQVKESGSLASN